MIGVRSKRYGVKKELWTNSSFFRVSACGFSWRFSQFSQSEDCGDPFARCSEPGWRG